MRSSVFPDTNVWLALTYTAHKHFGSAWKWLQGARGVDICFCRQTQLSLLRLVSTQAVMKEETMTQVQAWEAYDKWYRTDDRIRLVEEPSGLEAVFRSRTRGYRAVTPGDWADAYLISFAQLLGSTLVTFDRKLAERALPDSLLLS